MDNVFKSVSETATFSHNDVVDEGTDKFAHMVIQVQRNKLRSTFYKVVFRSKSATFWQINETYSSIKV